MPVSGTVFPRGTYTRGSRVSSTLDAAQGDNRITILISRNDGISALPAGPVGTLSLEYHDGLRWVELASVVVPGGAVPSGPDVLPATSLSTHLPDRARITRQVRAVWTAETDQAAEVILMTQATSEKDPDGPQPPNSVAWDNGNSAVATNTTSVSVSSFAVASNSNRCLIGVVGANNSAGAPGTVSSFTWNTSENLAQITSWDVTQTDTENWGYYLLAPTATTASLSVTLSASVNRLMLGAISLYNVNQSTPFGTIQSAQGTTGTAAAVGCAGDTDGMSLGFLFAKTEGASLTVASHAGYPYYVAVGTASQSAGATSLTPTGAPAGRLLGDVEFCSIANENNNAISCSGTGWTKLGSTVQQDSTWQQEIWYRIYDGSNVNPAFSWSGSVGCSARRWLMRDLNMADFIGFEATNSGSGSTHSTTGQNTTANLSRVMYVDHAEANTALATPSGWTENFDAGSATGPYRLAVGGKDVATSGTGSGNISVTGAAASWVQRQIELLAATAQSHRFEQESIDSGTCCGAVATEPGATYNTFRFDTNNTMSQWIIVAVSVKQATSSPQTADGVSGSVTLSATVGKVAPKGSASSVTASGVTGNLKLGGVSGSVTVSVTTGGTTGGTTGQTANGSPASVDVAGALGRAIPLGSATAIGLALPLGSLRITSAGGTDIVLTVTGGVMRAHGAPGAATVSGVSGGLRIGGIASTVTVGGGGAAWIKISGGPGVVVVETAEGSASGGTPPAMFTGLKDFVRSYRW